MKKIYFTTILLVIASALFSQTNKGSWLLGGKIQFYSTSTTESDIKSSASTFEINPKIGFFPVNNFAVILNTDYQNYSSDNFSDHTLLIGPALRYYFPASESVKFFLGAGVGFASGAGSHGTDYQFEAGPAFFITPAVAVEMNIGYENANFKSDGQYGGEMKQSRFGIGLGFMIYLGKKSK